MTMDFTPKQIVSELDRYIISQQQAKKSVAIALRNRWRRQQLDDQMREEILPKNILMIGPTGVGKTEISRRLSKLAQAPFTKVEATKFTEVGYVGRDVEQIIRDLVDISMSQTRDVLRADNKEQAIIKAEERILEAFLGTESREATRTLFWQSCVLESWMTRKLRLKCLNLKTTKCQHLIFQVCPVHKWVC